MSESLKTALKLSAAAASLVLITGCATHQHEEMSSRIDEALMTAEDAQATANDAQATADEAMSAARSSQSTADQALSAAQSAQQTADQNGEKIDRMFKKAMYK